MSEHAKLSPSSSARWTTCPGSVSLSEEAELLFGEEPTSDPALKGTCLHDIAERLLLDVPVTDEDMQWLNSKGETESVTIDDINNAVTPYVEYVNSLEGEKYIESRLVINDQVWGTGDAIVVNDDMLNVIDLKTGYHVVYAKDNTQLLIYALAAHLEQQLMYGYKEITVTISQPSQNHHDSYTYTVAEVEEFAGRLDDAIAAVESKPDHYVPSESACQWCPGRVICTRLEDVVNAAVEKDYRQMTINQIAESLGRVPEIKAWIKGIEDQSKELLEKGENLPGFKMVEGRKSRKWTDEAAAEKYFKNRVNRFLHNCYNMKFKSPAQMEKLLKREDVKIRGKVDFDKVVTTSGGAPTITTIDDKREALVYGDKAASDFAEVDQDMEDLLS